MSSAASRLLALADEAAALSLDPGAEIWREHVTKRLRAIAALIDDGSASTLATQAQAVVRLRAGIDGASEAPEAIRAIWASAEFILRAALAAAEPVETPPVTALAAAERAFLDLAAPWLEAKAKMRRSTRAASGAWPEMEALCVATDKLEAAGAVLLAAQRAAGGAS